MTNPPQGGDEQPRDTPGWQGRPPGQPGWGGAGGQRQDPQGPPFHQPSPGPWQAQPGQQFPGQPQPSPWQQGQQGSWHPAQGQQAPWQPVGSTGWGMPGPAGSPQQGPYGQPPAGWGAPAAPPRKSRAGLVVGLVVLTLVVVAGAVLLPGLLGSTRLDPQAVQRDVADQFADREGLSVDLDCPDDMAVTVGSTYTCTGTTADEESVSITIAITGEDGAYTWQEG